MHLQAKRKLTFLIAMIAGCSLLSFDFYEKNSAEMSSTIAQQALISFYADQAGKIQNVQKMMDPTPQDPICEECQSKPQNIQYMSCSSQNSYLDDDIQSVKNSSADVWKEVFKPTHSKPLIKPICIRMGMEQKFGPENKAFRYCSANGTLGRQKLVRPCISEDYFKLMSNSFDVVSHCMKDALHPNGSLEEQKQDVLSVYSLINIESGFHLNAFSPTGAAGVGQFTGDAIQYVNANVIPNMKKNLANSQNPVCRSLNSEILSDPMSAARKETCDRLSISEGNPLKNIVYTYAYLATTKSEIESTLFGDPRYNAKFNLPESDKQQIVRALAIWSHNTGLAGILTPTRTLLNNEYRQNKVTDPDAFLNRLDLYVRKFPAAANRSARRRAETGRYFPSISNTLNSIESNAGGGSCLN